MIEKISTVNTPSDILPNLSKNELAEESDRSLRGWHLRKANGPTKTADNIRQATNKKILNMVVFNKAKAMAVRLDNHTITEHTSTMSGDMISNFKNLQDNLGPLQAGSVIDYDSLLEKLFNVKHPMAHLFDFSAEKKEKDDEVLTLKFSLQEKGLLQKFQEAIMEIHQKKELDVKIREENYQLNIKIKALQNDVIQ